MDSSSRSATLAIDMRDVTVGNMRDQSVIAAEGVNWRVSAGEFWVIAGLQGSGKSDFLMMTAGLMPPMSGAYDLFGERMPIFDESRLQKRLRLGLVFEGGQLFNHLTVGENIALPLRYHENLAVDEAKARVQPLLEFMELRPWADSTPGTLGRNWQKRVGLARALVLKPEVMLVDSPLAGLDLRHANWWLNFLDTLGRGHAFLEGRAMTVIVTTADLRPWKKGTRQFAVLRDRRFEIIGGAKELEATGDELVQELLTV